MSNRFELVAFAFCLLPASTFAQVAYNASGPYYTNSNATAYQSGSAGQTLCTAENFQCPSCDGKNITNADNSNYKLFCGAYISSSAISQQPDPVTAEECLTACDGFFGCTGAYISKQGACSLSVGQIFGTIKSDEHSAFVSIGDDLPTNSTTSASTISNPTAISIALTAGTTITLSTYTPPAPFPNNTHPTPYTPGNVSYPNPWGYPKPSHANGTGVKPTGVVSPHPPQYNTTNPPPWLANATYGPNFTWPNTTLPSPSLANITYHPPNFTYPNATASNTTFLNVTLPTPLFPNATFPNVTLPAPIHSNATNQTCSINNLVCPACNNHKVVDDHSTTYVALCGYSLNSTSQYVFAEPLPAKYCLARCDERNATCVGTYWDDQECTLALGKLKAPIQDPDYIAFIRVGAGGAAQPTGTGGLPVLPMGTGLGSTGSSGLPIAPISIGLTWLNMSRYPEGSFTSGPTALPSVFSTGVLLSPAPTAASSLLSSGGMITSTPVNGPGIVTITSTVSPGPTCNPGAISCPACDGLRVVDTANETYRLQCNFKPTCDSLVGFYGLASLNVCMQRCDKDATCLAAVFNQGHCDICQRGIEGEYDGDVDYLVLIPETAEEASVSATLGMATMTSSTATYRTSAALIATTPIATTLSVATPVFPTTAALNATTFSTATAAFSVSSAPSLTASCNTTSPTCPECNGLTYSDPNSVIYTLDCEAVCITQSLWAPRGMISRDMCLGSCDNNSDCIAASYNPFGCGSCSNITYNDITPEARSLVYVRKSFAAPSESTTEEPAAPTGWENSPPILPSSFALHSQPGTAAPAVTTASSPMDASTVTCPTDDNAAYRASSGRSMNIACDSVLEADEFSQTTAASFDDCAAACTGECGGVQFSEDYGGCLLMTSISVVATSTGWTAGVAVMYPGTAGPIVARPTGGMGPAVGFTTTTDAMTATSTTFVAASSTAAITSDAATASAPVASSTMTEAPSATGALPGFGWRPWGGPGAGYPGPPPNGRPHGPGGGWAAGARGGGPWWVGSGRGRPE